MGRYTPEEVYSKDDVREILAHAKENGIRVIPEIDTPGHVGGWGNDATMNEFIIHNCPGGEGYNAQMDTTLNVTYKYVGGVL